MQLSVIILNYNVRYFLELCVSSVQAALSTLEAEIIVVDNNSTDDSCEMILNHFPNVKLIQNKENSGFPKGNNSGVLQAKGKYICVLNPDTVVAEDTFIKVLAFAERQKEIGIIGVKLIDGSGNYLPESKRGIPTPFVAFTKIFGLYKWFPKSRLLGKYYANHLDINQTGKVEILVGAFMVMERQLYQDIGGFDEDCFMYSDDIDLSYMVLQKGKSNYYFHDTTVIHYKGESTVKDGTYMKRFQEAMHFFYQKHFKVSSFFSLFMKIGIVFFSFVKMFQGKATVKNNPEMYFLFSSNESKVKDLAKVLQKEVKLINFENPIIDFNEFSSSNNSIEIILDSNFISYKKCISCMDKYKNKKVTFKIIPKNTSFLIGSDNSNERGTTLNF